MFIWQVIELGSLERKYFEIRTCYVDRVSVIIVKFVFGKIDF